jgi:glutathione peroxidase
MSHTSFWAYPWWYVFKEPFAPLKTASGLVSPPRALGSGMSLNDIPLVTLDGKPTSLAQYADKVKLIVNVASRCGLTPQYEKLEELQKKYGDRGFTVLAFPSNQFLQELGSSEAIAEFCSNTYGVTFPIFERIRVNGRNQHPLYTELTKTPDAAGKAGKIKWNFEKFVVTPSGEVHRFRPKVEPDAPEILELIETSLPPLT